MKFLLNLTDNDTEIITMFKYLDRFNYGTVARAEYPAGKKTLFYRDKKGQNWPVMELIKGKNGAKSSPAPDLKALIPLEVFRQLLVSADKTLKAGELETAHQLPLPFKEMMFEQHRLIVDRIIARGEMIICWEKSGISVGPLAREIDSGTIYKAKPQEIKPPV